MNETNLPFDPGGTPLRQRGGTAAPQPGDTPKDSASHLPGVELIDGLPPGHEAPLGAKLVTMTALAPAGFVEVDGVGVLARLVPPATLVGPDQPVRREG
jgi:hypothetical protein